MAKKKAAPRKKATGKKRAPAEKVNKSQAIRDFAEANPTVGPTDTAAALTEQGLDVSPAMVSQVKSKMKQKRRGRRRKKAAAPTQPAGETFELSTLVKAKKLAEQMGSIDKAQAALAALVKLQ
jgi:hypothetical protein